MRYLVALALLWWVPVTSLGGLVLLSGGSSDSSVIAACWYGVVLGGPPALALTAAVIPAMALAQVSDHLDRRRGAPR